MKTYEHWGQYIQAKRIEKDITLREFCRETKIDPSNWSKIERGIADPPKDRALLKSIIVSLELTNFEAFRFWLLYSDSNTPRKTQSVYDNLPIILSGAKEKDLKRLFELIKNS